MIDHSISPDHANPHLIAGVELEEAGEKWRAGDAAKSMRFFMRAISNYDEGLQKHPVAFDLAYNKCVFTKSTVPTEDARFMVGFQVLILV